jgi:hypothetical protein
MPQLPIVRVQGIEGIQGFADADAESEADRRGGGYGFIHKFNAPRNTGRSLSATAHATRRLCATRQSKASPGLGSAPLEERMLESVQTRSVSES